MLELAIKQLSSRKNLILTVVRDSFAASLGFKKINGSAVDVAR